MLIYIARRRKKTANALAYARSLMQSG